MPTPAAQPTAGAQAFFDSLKIWADLEALITAGESEDLFVECKTIAGTQLNKDQKVKLATALSGFSNTMGGVVMWGVSTTQNPTSGLDVMTQLVPIGRVQTFAQHVEAVIPTLAVPMVATTTTKVIPDAPKSSRGIALTLIPQSPGDPVQSLQDSRFYLRTPTGFVEMPYETIKRMYASTQGPVLQPVFDARLITRTGDVWGIPIALDNQSSAATTTCTVFVEFLNADACSSITPTTFVDVSNVNPGRSTYSVDFPTPIYRGLRQAIGSFQVTMKKGARAKRVLRIRIQLYASHMRARRWTMTVQLAKKRGFSVKKSVPEDIY